MNQRHIIKKQILDITIDSQIGSFTFQSKVSDFFKREIVPALDAYCTSISRDSGVIRIERLEINLGVIPKNRFETIFIQKLAKEFPVKVVDAMQLNLAKEAVLYGNDEVTVNKEARTFELLEFFIKEGQLPWWAENVPKWDIPAILEQYIAQQPTRLKNFISTFDSKPDWMKRLIYHARDLAKERILALFRPQDYREVWKLSQELVKELIECPLLASVNPEKLKCEAWLSILSQVIALDGEPFERRFVIEATVKHIAGSGWVDFSRLDNYITKRISVEKRANGKLFKNFLSNTAGLPDTNVRKLEVGGADTKKDLGRFEIIKDLTGLGWLAYNRFDHYFTKRISNEKKVSGKLFTNLIRNIAGLPESKILKLKIDEDETNRYLEQLEIIDEFLHELQQGLTKIQSGNELSASAQRILADEALRIFELVNNISDILIKAGKAEPIALKPLEKAALDKQVKMFVEGFAEIHSHLKAVAIRKKKYGNHTLNKKLTQSIEMVQKLSEIALPPPAFSPVSVFSASSEIFVANAGLVLIWSYLERFFSHLGLIREKTFVNEDARERAVLLLQNLVENTGKIREEDLMLNKILCGMDPATPVNPFLKVAKTEIAEGEKLLEAVIQNWPALKNLSPLGLRELFLQREGMIFTRDGLQVLRVTEQAYDILVDQMPWGMGIVKLPWMSELLLVEWRI